MIKIKINKLKIYDRVLLSDFQMEFRNGSVNLLTGPNGSGKSLVLDILFNDTSTNSGVALYFGDKNITKFGLYKKWELGFRKLFQFPIMPMDISVKEVLEKCVCQHGEITIPVESIFELSGISINSELSTLSYGQKRVIELIICISNGKYFFLDEPFAGLTKPVVSEFHKLIKQKSLNGAVILIIDHSANEFEQFYDKTYSLYRKENIYQKTEKTETINIPETKSVNSINEWEIENLSIEGKMVLQNTIISLPKGKLLLLKGKNGSGKSTLLRALGGFAQPKYNIHFIVHSNVQRKECILSPQPPKLIEGISVLENLFLSGSSGAKKLASNDFLFLIRMHINYFGLRPSILKLSAESLSGGEASLIALIGACLSRFPLVYLDEPFENMDNLMLVKVQTYLCLFSNRTFIISDHNTRLDLFKPWITINLSI